MDMQGALKALTQRRNLSREQTQEVMTIIMEGEATPAQIGAFLVALSMKGETVEEIVGAATVMRKFAAGVHPKAPHIVDCVGTGGDGAGLFNVSTASALVAAAAGAHVAKHGNRAATGKSGSADFLEASGVNIALTPEQVAACIDEVGIGFMFAPTHHGATRHAIGPRREIGVRNIFNLLGPLTNPAGARHLLVGVFSRDWVRPIAEVFGQLGALHVLVVHSVDGLDEISIAAPTHVAELVNGGVREYQIAPADFDIEPLADIAALAVDSAADSRRVVEAALSGTPGPAADMIALNAGATIYAADMAGELREGVARAREILAGGSALDRLRRLAEFSSGFSNDPR